MSIYLFHHIMADLSGKEEHTPHNMASQSLCPGHLIIWHILTSVLPGQTSVLGSQRIYLWRMKYSIAMLVFEFF